VRARPGTAGVLLAVPPGGWPERLAGDRLLNRCVRGLLRALPRAGATGGAFYFGRDFVVSQHRHVATVSQDGARGGTLLFEAIVAATAPLAVPAAYPEHPDPRAPGPPPGDLGDPGFERLAAAIVDGYGTLLQATPTAEPVAPDEGPPLAPPVDEDEAGLAWSAPAPIPIGFVQAGARAESGRIGEVRLRGDFIAPAFAVAALEAALRGRRFDLADVGPELDAAFGPGAQPMIGVRDLRALADCILEAGRVCFAP
jgi:hypothetical protein